VTPTNINRRAARRLPYTFAKTQGVVLTDCEQRAALAVRRDAKPEAVAEVMRQLALPVDATLVDAEEFELILSDAYSQADESTAMLLDDAEQDMDLSMLLHDLPKSSDLLESENDAPVIRMINALLAQAVRDNASDIHIEPFETRSVVRFRLDGTLKDIAEPHRALHAAMV
jgi:general secretion pathway protein E